MPNLPGSNPEIDKQTIDDLAYASSTVGYEILTSLGSRYKRVYHY